MYTLVSSEQTLIFISCSVSEQNLVIVFIKVFHIIANSSLFGSHSLTFIDL